MTEATPLAERIRPESLDQIAGQQHLVGNGSVLRNAIENGHIPSMILWGPPGVGKTTLANVIAHTLNKPFYQLSAISSGVKEVREVIDVARKQMGAILFIDEIHRFNKGQQDALLGAVEKGTITLIGATTENPSFEVNSALISRSQVYVLKDLEKEDLEQLLQYALTTDGVLKHLDIKLQETTALLRISGGDARKLLNLFELVIQSLQGKKKGMIVITDKDVMEIAQNKIAIYDKQGDQHYDIISAFIKSMRGSDPNAAVYYLARMLAGGEDVKFIARRMVIFASEDIGNANPNALLLANATFDAVNKIGHPEARIILAQCATYLAATPKSNASYLAIEMALSLVKETGDLSVPLHIRNAPTKLMKDLGYHEGYQYSHDYDNHFSNQEFLPKEIEGTKFYDPGHTPREDELRRNLKSLWKGKYGY